MIFAWQVGGARDQRMDAGYVCKREVVPGAHDIVAKDKRRRSYYVARIPQSWLALLLPPPPERDLNVGRGGGSLSSCSSSLSTAGWKLVNASCLAGKWEMRQVWWSQFRVGVAL